jgi:hypothetical protein
MQLNYDSEMEIQIPSRSKTVLIEVAAGKSLAQAGKAIGKSGTTANQVLAKLCRTIQMPHSLSEIRENKEEYFKKIEALSTNSSVEQLAPNMAKNLASALQLRQLAELTPDYVSNVTASQLLSAGLSLIAVAEVQIWLTKSGKSLSRKPPNNQTETSAASRAIALLDAFQFETKAIHKQLAHLTCNDD